MIKKVKVTLLVEVDTEENSGDPLKDNCVLNTVKDKFFLSPVSVLDTSYYGEDREFIELNWSKDLTQDQYDYIKNNLISGYKPEDLTEREIEIALEDYEEDSTNG